MRLQWDFLYLLIQDVGLLCAFIYCLQENEAELAREREDKLAAMRQAESEGEARISVRQLVVLQLLFRFSIHSACINLLFQVYQLYYVSIWFKELQQQLNEKEKQSTEELTAVLQEKQEIERMLQEQRVSMFTMAIIRTFSWPYH